MKFLTKEEFEKKIEKIRKRNTQIEYLIALKDERNKVFNSRKIETSKLLAYYLFIILNAIIIYSMVAMWRFGDLTYLGVLITDIAAQVILYMIYCAKAYKAKKSEEDLKFEREKYFGSTEEFCTQVEDDIEYIDASEDEFAG